MRILANEALKKVTGIRKLPPVYYMQLSTIEEADKCRDIPCAVATEALSVLSGNSIDLSTLGTLSDLLEIRPFDELLVVVNVEPDDYLGYSLAYSALSEVVLHFTKEGEFRTFAHAYNGDFYNLTIREQVTTENFLSRDTEKDRYTLELATHLARLVLNMFSIKKSVISFCEGRTVGVGKKKKVSKQRFLYVSTEKYLHKTKPSGVKVSTQQVCFDVIGHKRTYHKKPKTRGHSRKGDPVVGWTWVSSSQRGKGKEYLEKIRIFLK